MSAEPNAVIANNQSKTNRLPTTLAQKLIARACGLPNVNVGEIVTCNVDLAMFHDSSGPRRLQPMLDQLQAQIWDKSKVVLVMDHYVPERDDQSRKIIQLTRDWARDQAMPYVYDSVGICHVVLPEHGHILPGRFCVGGDSHSPTGGAFGAYMFGIGSTEMLGVLVTGEIWLKVPETILFDWSGRLQPGVGTKDMMLSLLATHGMNGGRYQAVEFCGSAVRALDMQERMTLCNMSAELGAQTGLVAPDQTTLDYLASVGVSSSALQGVQQLFTDTDASVDRHAWDASRLAPQIAAPHSPANAQDVGQFTNVVIDTAYIGACTGAKLVDMRAAAQVLKGNRIAKNVQLLLAPASIKDQEQARSEGVLQVLLDAGAQLLATSCGACAGYGNSVADHSTVISTTARNFKGRMGSSSAQVYLGSPYSVAAAALRGVITDPREVLQ
jgi:3-isopropylmalate/(R)-2-methylmalate dehydratase large subunit